MNLDDMTEMELRERKNEIGRARSEADQVFRTAMLEVQAVIDHKQAERVAAMQLAAAGDPGALMAEIEAVASAADSGANAPS